MNARNLLIALSCMILISCAHQPPPLVQGPNGYFIALQDYVTRSVVYPPKSAHSGEEGMCNVKVVFERDGRITEIQLLKSTGFRQLDEECIAVFQRIESFPPMPKDKVPQADAFSLRFPINFTRSVH